MKKEHKLLLAYVANLNCMIDIVDELQFEKYYKHKMKNLGNRCLEEAEKVINELYFNMDEDAEMQYHDAVSLSTFFINAIKEKDLDLLRELLKSFVNDEVFAGDEDTTKKLKSI